MGYLDQDGLAYLWQKINTAIDEKLEGVTAQEVYSTEEQRIGTWIDGKPLYQKTILGTTNTSHGGTIPTLEFDYTIQVQSYECRMTYSSLYAFFMDSASGGNDWWVTSSIYPPNSPTGHVPGLYIQWGSAVNNYANPLTYLLTIKYTKTTDTATKQISAQSDTTIKLSNSALDFSSIQTAPVTAAAAGVEIAKMEEV